MRDSASASPRCSEALRDDPYTVCARFRSSPQHAVISWGNACPSLSSPNLTRSASAPTARRNSSVNARTHSGTASAHSRMRDTARQKIKMLQTSREAAALAAAFSAFCLALPRAVDAFARSPAHFLAHCLALSP